MLSHSQLPISYWSYAISTAVHIVNRLPTPNLQNLSPSELLFHSRPDIKHLRTFGCDCFPLLKPYNNHKLQPHTTSCIFLGYPAYTKGYIFLDPITSRIYISRNVLFNETDFLSSQSLSTSPNCVSSGQSLSTDPHLHQFSPFVHLSPLTSPTMSPTSTPHSHPTQSMPLSSSRQSLSSLPISTVPLSSTSQSPQSQPSESQPVHLSIPPVLSPSSVLDPSTTIPHVTSTVQVPLTTNSHPMVTRSKNGISKPKAMLAKTESKAASGSTKAAKPDYTITKPPSFKVVVQHPQWCKAMDEEFATLQR